MDGSMVVGKVASEDSSKQIVINLDAIQCSVEQFKGREFLSATKVRKIKIKENEKFPVIEGIKSNKLGKNGNKWSRSIVVIDKAGNKERKHLCDVENDYYSKALNEKLVKAREKSGSSSSKKQKGIEKA